MIDCMRDCKEDVPSGSTWNNLNTECIYCLREQLEKAEAAKEMLAEKHASTVVKYGAKVVEIAELKAGIANALEFIDNLDCDVSAYYATDKIEDMLLEALK